MQQLQDENSYGHLWHPLLSHVQSESLAKKMPETESQTWDHHFKTSIILLIKLIFIIYQQ